MSSRDRPFSAISFPARIASLYLVSFLMLMGSIAHHRYRLSEVICYTGNCD
jgi:hypothetical protein